MCWMLAIDWNAWGSVVGGFGDLIAGIGTIALAYFGFRGLSDWRLQLEGTKKVEVSQDLLINAYVANEALKYITAPFIMAGELEKIERLSGESDDDYRLRQNYESISNRYLEHVEVFNKLRASCFAAKVILGEDVYDAAIQIVTLPQHILNSASSLNFTQRVLSNLNRQVELGMAVEGAQWREASERYDQAYNYFYGLSEKHSLDRKREEAIASLEDLVRKARDAKVSLKNGGERNPQGG